MNPIELLVRLPHSHIDPNRLFAVEFENGNQPRVCGSVAKEAVATNAAVLPRDRSAVPRPLQRNIEGAEAPNQHSYKNFLIK